MGHALDLAKQQLWKYSTTFTAEQIPDLTGRVVIVTGEEISVHVYYRGTGY